MKTAIYIEDGVTQLVITPETEFEQKSLKVMENKDIECEIFHGSFYDSRGGWIRQTAYDSFDRFREDNSLIIQAKKIATPKGE